MSVIYLPFGNNSFDSKHLIEYLKRTDRNFIIQGQKKCTRIDHPKPKSLDCWLRDNYAKNPNIMQAVNQVIIDLVKTGDFVEGKFPCPDSNRLCKGIEIVKRRV